MPLNMAAVGDEFDCAYTDHLHWYNPVAASISAVGSKLRFLFLEHPKVVELLHGPVLEKEAGARLNSQSSASVSVRDGSPCIWFVFFPLMNIVGKESPSAPWLKKNLSISSAHSISVIPG